MSESEFRKVINDDIRRNILFESQIIEVKIAKQRKAQINTHIDKLLSEFSKELRKIATENDHPYLRFYLNSAISQLKKTIEKGEYIAAGMDEIYLSSYTQ